MLITNKAQYLLQDFDMAKGDFDMLYLCAGGGGGRLWYFPFINHHLLRGGQKRNPEMIRGLQKTERKK